MWPTCLPQRGQNATNPLSLWYFCNEGHFSHVIFLPHVIPKAQLHIQLGSISVPTTADTTYPPGCRYMAGALLALPSSTLTRAIVEMGGIKLGLS